MTTQTPYMPGPRHPVPKDEVAPEDLLDTVNRLNERFQPAHRVAILEKASNLITGDRAEAYGDFGEQMRAIAGALSALTGKPFIARDVALLLILLKMRRIVTSADLDSYIDLCGYGALMGQYFSVRP